MKAYFQFTRRQKIGVATTATGILALVTFLNVNYHRDLPDPTDVDVSSISFNQPEVSNNSVNPYKEEHAEYNKNYSNSSHSDLFEFDPNELDAAGWESLGFSEKQAMSIVDYRSNYGPFENPEDVEKIYVVSDEKYQEIKPYMLFEEQEYEADLTKLIEVNTATQEELESIRGIGPVFAKRTIKYRDLLGGYASKDQFRKIYGITDEAIVALKENVTIDKTQIERLNINTASKEEIERIEHLKDWPIVAAILKQRDQKKLNSLNFLVDKGLMSPSELDQVLPYIQY